ncbi:LamG domain-containing protein [Alteromonas sp. a30]|uniref:LamG domain-containing protein n=1 Tax=Alteromonas sp. a30 TaxID=2730917 RepID=UPI0022831C55|nr:LamG domain-containing protein [Alteromonas sp. a30]MCY7296619.1 LamG domain-containing protein [Alteromonas sp. a30]
MIDIGPNSYNGSVVYGSVSSARDRHGVFGGALSFSGDVVEIPQLRNYNFGSELTISFWMNRTVNTDYMGIINNGITTESFDVRMGRENNGTFLFAQSNWSDGRTSSSSRNVIRIGNWHHVAVVLNNGSSKMYIDGNFIHESVTNPGTLAVINRPVIIGANANGRNHENFRGFLDDVILFNEALSDEAVRSIANDSYSSAFNITLSPSVEAPSVPSTGGNINYDLSFNNDDTNTTSTFQTWGIVTLEDGQDIVVHPTSSINVAPGTSYTLSAQPFSVEEWWPAGQHTFRWYVSDPAEEGGNILSARFTFRKD